VHHLLSDPVPKILILFFGTVLLCGIAFETNPAAAGIFILKPRITCDLARFLQVGWTLEITSTIQLPLGAVFPRGGHDYSAQC
jgi:hypothetical protein